MDAQEYQELTKRALHLLENKTCDLAEGVLRVKVSDYTDREIAQSERAYLESIPLPVLTTARVRNPGDFEVRELLGRSLLITRDGDGKAHVLLNYCRHRGAQVAKGAGNARRFSCPYHDWTFDRGGQLVGRPAEHGFTGCPKSDLNLVELASEERLGFIWARLDGEPRMDLSEHLGDFEAQLGYWSFEDYYYVNHGEYVVDGNWKAAVEAFSENYHFQYLHADSVVGQGAYSHVFTYDKYGKHHRLGIPLLSIEELEGVAMEEWPEGHHHVALLSLIFPTTAIAVGPFGLEVVEAFPTDEPGRCSFRHTFLARVPPTDEEEREGLLELFEEVHAVARDEDLSTIVAVAKTAREGHLSEFVIGRNEPGVQNLQRELAALRLK